MKDKPWVTKELKQSSILNSKLYKKSIKCNDPLAVERYHAHNKNYKAQLKKAEIDYHKDIFSNKTTSIKDLWKHLGNLINHKNKNSLTRIDKISYKGKSYTKDTEIADAMDDHFCTVGESLQNKLPRSNDNAYKEFLPNPSLNSFFLSHVIAEEIMIEIHKLDPKEAAGPDNIGPKIIKLCPEIFASNLEKYLINR